jgi:hypothetical protein
MPSVGRFPSVTFNTPGDSVTGRILATEDYQETIYDGSGKGKPRFCPNSGNPVMGVRITLETAPGYDTSRMVLWAQGKNLMQSIVRAIRAAGASDVTVGDFLTVTMTGDADAYQAEYVRAAEHPPQGL